MTEETTPQPRIAQKSPYIVDEQPGKKWWCACGRSKNQPYCDGAHKEVGMKPIAVEIEQPRKVAWCGCKHSGNKPFCDGTHNSL